MRYKTLGPTAGAADTETRIGAADFEFSTESSWTIKKILVSYGHVVDAKSPCAVFELKINTLAGPFKWVIGFGAGGAATTMAGHAETINCNIPIAAGSKVGAYVTFADAAADVQVALGYIKGGSGQVTYSDMPALTASISADTRTSLGSITINPHKATYKLLSIRVGLGQVVNAKASSCKIELTGVPNINSDELTLTVGGRSSGATNSGHMPAEEHELDVECNGNKTITVYATPVDAAVESGYSIMYQ